MFLVLGIQTRLSYTNPKWFCPHYKKCCGGSRAFGEMPGKFRGESHQFILENAEAPQEIDGVEQYAFRLACEGAVLHADLYLRDANLVVFVQSQQRSTNA